MTILRRTLSDFNRLKCLPTVWPDIRLTYLAHFAALVVLEVKKYEFVRTTSIVVKYGFFLDAPRYRGKS